MKYLGAWVRPWPGENVVGHVVAVEGEHLVCRTVGGQQFLVDIADVIMGRVAEFGASLLPRPAPPPGPGDFGRLIRERMTG